jgi:hypothetical protein
VGVQATAPGYRPSEGWGSGCGCLARLKTGGEKMEALDELRALLQGVPPGKIPAELETRVLELLEGAWEFFDGAGDTKMAAYKVWRAEDLCWEPPVLTFIVERHGAFECGSTRAELQEWAVNLETREASQWKKGYRQLLPMEPRWYAKPAAERIAKIILEKKEDSAIRWLKGDKVMILTAQIIPECCKQTRQGRTKRFYRELDAILAPYGWKRSVNVYTRLNH